MSALLALPASAQAATPGVNLAGLPGPAALDEAAATGAKQIRVFALRDQFPGHYADFRTALAGARARGMSVVFVLMGSGRGSDTDPGPFARWAGEFSAQMAQAGGAAAYEVWNEPDEPEFWRGPPDAGRYVRILKAAYPRIRAGDPGAKVLLGSLTGNNHRWLRGLYSRGVRGSFDAVAVHTDTACRVEPPSAFIRDGGRVSRWSFLGFRSVRDVMVARGDGAKPIWMTELGWSTATSPCARGAWAGRKPAGVSEAVQAAHLAEAYRCLANYPYVESALWFTLDDTAGHGDELDNYGLRREDGSRKPAWDAFRSLALHGAAPAPCGDFGGPTLSLRSPARPTTYVGALTLSAVATDPSGVKRITFRIDGRTIRNYTGADVASGRPVTLEWQGAKRLGLGGHTLSVVALDANRNVSRRDVRIRRVSGLRRTLRTAVELGPVSVGAGRVASVGGRVVKSAAPGLSGVVRVEWQRMRGGRWRTDHKLLVRADRPFRIRQALPAPGTWRVRATYVGKAPYLSSWAAVTFAAS
jgi:Big-like domain-containing protein